MKVISRREAFECGVALILSVANTLESGKRTLRFKDFILILKKGSTSPIICHQPGTNFVWNDQGHQYNENSYGYLPLGRFTESHLFMLSWRNEDANTYEVFEAKDHPCSWIKNALLYDFIETESQSGMPNSFIEAAHWIRNTSLFSKNHSTWIKITTDDDFITYMPFYPETERANLFSNPKFRRAAEQLFDQFDEDF